MFLVEMFLRQNFGKSSFTFIKCLPKKYVEALIIHSLEGWFIAIYVNSKTDAGYNDIKYSPTGVDTDFF